jgi:hypothetical protein
MHWAAIEEGMAAAGGGSKRPSWRWRRGVADKRDERRRQGPRKKNMSMKRMGLFGPAHWSGFKCGPRTGAVSI